MKAIVYENYGTPEVLQVREVKKPTPKKNEILIKVHAAEATKSDCEMRSFNFQVKWFWLPLRIAMGILTPRNKILGGYFSGEIETVGKEVTKFKKGQQVFGSAQLRMGAYGEYVCLPAKYTIVPKPNNMSYEQAAAVPLGGLNALHYLRKAKIKKGEKVLVNGAGGSIGTFGVQIAKTMGAEVTAVDHTIKKEMLLRLGADQFIDYTKEDFTTNEESYDIIFDMVANSSYSKCVKALKTKGRYLMANPRMSKMLRSAFTSKLTDKTSTFVFAGEKEEELLTLKEMIEKGQIKATVDKIYPMQKASEAHERVESEKRLGCIVISVE